MNPESPRAGQIGRDCLTPPQGALHLIHPGKVKPPILAFRQSIPIFPKSNYEETNG
jgi:hypothetical protein